MTHYTFAREFHALYDHAVQLYASGQRDAATYFNTAQSAWLAANGLTAQHLYDYAEDQNNGDEPGYDIALGIELVRRDYYLNVQGGRPSPERLAEDTLPPKDAAVEDVVWLPRIIPKARAKLRGELPATLMYCCGGDRRFFKNNDIHPAEFLAVVWRAGDSDQAIIDWVVRRIDSLR
ncbi:DUF5069 domain-containing protein [Opitutaceae bacterium TAV4]|nr:DUF5069 domain-containing protein [Opitutaceae bacterium TAV4]RRK02676.1 DUF5069 domain-containing protein [Opitutaceae bacterium TAV3]